MLNLCLKARSDKVYPKVAFTNLVINDIINMVQSKNKILVFSDIYYYGVYIFTRHPSVLILASFLYPKDSFF